MSGWIKLHRSIQDHFIYDFSEPDKALAWIDILLSASYAESKVKIKSRLFSVQKGQWLVSQVTLQKRWKMSQNKVKRLLKLLENDGMISVLTNELTSIITICNFSDYQNDERANEQAHGRAVERTTNEQSNDILRSKEYKEVKNKTIVDSDEPTSDKKDFLAGLFDKFWKHYKTKQGKQKAMAKFKLFLKGKTESQSIFWMNLMLAYYEHCLENQVVGYAELHAATYIHNRRWEDNPEFMKEFKSEWLKANANG
jgi:hypothetical protein